MSKKMEFVEQALAPGAKLAPLCRQFGISRQTGYKWLERFKEEGFAGLEERSRRALSSPLAFGEELVAAVLASRDAHPSWGPRKIHELVKRRFKERTPSPATIARMLRRFGRVRERRKRRPVSLVERAPAVAALAPNDVWTIDFKGWWTCGDGKRCEPLTVRDAFSRFVFTVTLTTLTFASVKRVLAALFRKYGLPSAIQCDNGVPFISVRSRGGLSRLSAWWLSLGIQVVRGRLGCPQDNGAHERMHGDIAREVERAPAPNLVEQQRILDRWRQEFNHVRPHDALGGKTPADVYKPSERRVRDAVPPNYPSHFAVRMVGGSGKLAFHGDKVFLGVALGGHTVGLERLTELRWRVWFYDVDCGEVELLPPYLDHFVPHEGSSTSGRPKRHDAHHQVGAQSGPNLTVEPMGGCDMSRQVFVNGV